MTEEEFNQFCASLPHTTYVMQWGGSHVWKIGGKVFVIGTVGREGSDSDFVAASFKVSDFGFDVMKDQEGLRPAPYLASRGMKWIQRTSSATLDDEAFKDYLCESYRLVALGLTKKLKKELGLEGFRGRG